jgi:hypothetical protein
MMGIPNDFKRKSECMRNPKIEIMDFSANLQYEKRKAFLQRKACLMEIRRGIDNSDKKFGGDQPQNWELNLPLESLSFVPDKKSKPTTEH